MGGRWRVVTDSPGERYFYFLLSLFLFPNYNNSPFALCVGTGGEKTNTFEDPHCKDYSLNCGCSYFRCKFPWIIVITIPGMVPWRVENSSNFIPHSTKHYLLGKCLRHLGEQSPEKRERN